MASSLTVEKFFTIVGRDDDPNGTRDAEVQALLEGSEAKIKAYTSPTGNPLHGVWVDSLCSVIQLDVVKRAYLNPDMVASDAMGPQSKSYPAPGGLFLLPGEREELDKLKAGSSSRKGLGTIRMDRPDYHFWS